MRAAGLPTFIRVRALVFWLTLISVVQLSCGSGGAGPGVAGCNTAKGSGHSVTVTWSSQGASNFNVYRSTVSGGPYTLIGSSSCTTYVDTAVSGGKEYCYEITAVSNGRESPPSQESCATVPSP